MSGQRVKPGQCDCGCTACQAGNHSACPYKEKYKACQKNR